MRLIWKSIHRVLWILLAVPILLLPMLTRMAWAAGGETPEFRRAGADGAVTVRILGAEGHIEEQNLEDYLVGVVLGEIPADFEEEALKAQAVAARTYTRKAMVTGGKHGEGLLCREAGCCQAYWDPEDFLAQGGRKMPWQCGGGIIPTFGPPTAQGRRRPDTSGTAAAFPGRSWRRLWA